MMDNGAFHTGSIFGLPSKVIMSLSSFVLVAQTITGYLIWWKKLRKSPPSQTRRRKSAIQFSILA